ncbi:hypothetical protein RUM43_011470 [Polyplax serrata]|uniref:Sensory neuron membrane protein 1 n=1 Tax=Polyplax serrata TaxID=468196 RepID=A0AAN8NT36_POLSC
MKLAEKLGFIGTTVSLTSIAFGWGIFPWFVKLQIGKIKGLSPGTESRDFWEKIPFAFDFKIYLFNVTNYLEVQKGGVPQLEEIGPYYYAEYKEKTDLVDYQEDDSVSFYMKNTWIFNKEKTAPLTGEEIVIVPHPLLMGLILAVERDRAGILPLINKAIPILFDKPDSIFVKVKVFDFLFRGIIFNCTTKDFAASAVCAVLKKETNFLEDITPSVSKFSLLNNKNGTSEPNKFQVSRGITDYSKVGEVMTVNGKKKLSFWRGRPCNSIRGTDGTVFPPDIKPENDIWSFNMDLCRSLPAKYVGKTEFKSISTLRYNVTLGDMANDPALKCFCTDDTKCLKRGVADLLKCGGIPIVASQPHFFDAHEDYQNGVRGLNPNAEDHGIYFDIEPMTGTPLHAKKRIQFSFPLRKINKINITQTLPNVLLPFVWLEEGVELPDHLIEKIDSELFRILRFLDVIKWVATLFGAAIVSGGIGLYYKEQNALPITPSSGSSRQSDFKSDKVTQNHELGHTNLAYIN